MALRYVRPLEHEDWLVLMAELEKGASPEQQEMAKKAVAETKRLGIDKFPN